MTEILLYGPIGVEVTAAQIAREVSAADADEPITLRINSGGGDVMEGLAILSSLARHPVGFHAEIDGIAGSMAAIIAMQASHLTMAPDGWLMFHRISAGVAGTAPELIELAERMERMEENMVSFLSRKLGETPEKIIELLNESIWLNGEDALAAGLVEELTPAAAIAAYLGVEGESFYPRGAPAEALTFLDKRPTKNTRDTKATTTDENTPITLLYFGP